MNDRGVALPFEPAREGEQDPVSALVLGRPTVRRATPADLRFAIYARYSDPSQKKDSIKRQVFNASRYLNSIGVSSWKVFSDEGISASHANREALNALLQAIRRNEINGIVIEDFDRFSREVYDATDLFEELEKHHCKLHSAVDGRALSKDDAIQKAIQAEKDRSRRTMLLTSGKYQMAMAGKVPWGAFFGYDPTSTKGEITINLDHASTISRIFELAASGKPIRKIARTMDHEQRVGPDDCAQWQFQTVRRIIHNPLYVGRLFLGRDERIRDRLTGKSKLRKRDPAEVLEIPVPGLCIVDSETWLKANESTGQRDKKNRKSYAAQNISSILPKYMKCDCPGVIGQHFLFHNDRNSTQACCNLANKDGSCKAKANSVSVRIIERTAVNAVREYLKTRITDPTFTDQYRAYIAVRNAEREAEKARLQKLVKDKNSFLDRVFIDTYGGSSGFGSERVNRHVAGLEAEIDSLKAMILAIEPSLDAKAVQASRLLTTDAALEALEQRLPFQADSKVDDDLVVIMRDLMPKIQIQREGRPLGSGGLDISVSVSKLFGLDDATAPHDTIHAEFKQRIACSRWQTVEETIQNDASHRFSVPDEIWDRLERELPVGRAKRAGLIPPRRLVEIILLAMGTNISMSNVPADLWDPLQLHRAFIRFVHNGGLETLERVVDKGHPAFPEGLPIERFALMPRGLPVLRSTPPAFHETITDAEWNVIGDALQKEREARRQRGPKPDRRYLVNVILYALRTSLPWYKVPYRNHSPSALLVTVTAMVRRGEWALAEGVISQHFPHLLDGAELWRMDRLVADSAGEIRSRPDVHVDLTEEEWASIRQILLGIDAGLQTADPRLVVNGILWISRNNRPWTDLPSRYGSVPVIRSASHKWRARGLWDRVIIEIQRLYAGSGSHVRWIYSLSPMKLNGQDRTESEILAWIADR